MHWCFKFHARSPVFKFWTDRSLALQIRMACMRFFFIFPVLLSSFFCPIFCVGWWVYLGHALRYGDVVRRKMVCNDITEGHVRWFLHWKGSHLQNKLAMLQKKIQSSKVFGESLLSNSCFLRLLSSHKVPFFNAGWIEKEASIKTNTTAHSTPCQGVGFHPPIPKGTKENCLCCLSHPWYKYKLW